MTITPINNVFGQHRLKYRLSPSSFVFCVIYGCIHVCLFEKQPALTKVRFSLVTIIGCPPDIPVHFSSHIIWLFGSFPFNFPQKCGRVYIIKVGRFTYG